MRVLLLRDVGYGKDQVERELYQKTQRKRESERDREGQREIDR